MITIVRHFLRANRYLRLVLVLLAAPHCGAEPTAAPTAGAESTSSNGAPHSTALAPLAPSVTGTGLDGAAESASTAVSNAAHPTNPESPATADAPDVSSAPSSSSEPNFERETDPADGETNSTQATSSVPSNEGTSGQTSSSEPPAATGPCEYPEPPEAVAAWVDESWQSQLGDNIRNRSAWLLDNVIKGHGELNLCVRWGATTPPSAAVKSGVAPALRRWMNDWFATLGTYGCFPYPDGIDVRVTGWAVRPGNEAWVADLDDDVAVYTEVDAEGEPKCPDACSFFVNWDHEFSNCPGGDVFHTDYWVWVSDALPGGGGAAAVGGDWGLRMPAESFEDRIDSDADLVIEHEIGHGFGFQDYYDWTGSTPNGGSLMIVGSTSMQSPTVGDAWLLRRTWREMQSLRGW